MDGLRRAGNTYRTERGRRALFPFGTERLSPHRRNAYPWRVGGRSRRRGRGLPGGPSASVTPGQERLVLAAFEAGDRLFICTRLDPSQWKSARTTNATERLNEEFRRRIKPQTVLPCPETVPMLLWALLASGQIQMRKVDG